MLADHFTSIAPLPTRRASSAIAACMLLATVSVAGCSGGTSPSDAPPRLTGRLTAGNDFTCALDHTGMAHCWGAGSQGQLGNGTGLESVTPVLVNGGPYTSINAEQEGVCALRFDGTVDCWGVAPIGCCGLPGSGSVLEPVRLTISQRFTQFATGIFFECGIGRQFDAYCFGFGDNGQLGNGQDTSASLPPVRVAGNHKFVSLGAAALTTCGLDTAGSAWCWGANFFGELGIGDSSVAQDSVPVAVAGGFDFTSLSVGSAYACGVTTTGATLCWGLNFTGQLGDGTLTNRASPTAVPGAHFVSVFTGAKNALIAHTCGLDASGAASCWGLNDRGQLGSAQTGSCSPNMDSPCALAPVPVQGGLSFITLALGDAQTCGMVADGHVYCWGGNQNGELGDGTTTSSALPVLTSFTP